MDISLIKQEDPVSYIVTVEDNGQTEEDKSFEKMSNRFDLPETLSISIKEEPNTWSENEGTDNDSAISSHEYIKSETTEYFELNTIDNSQLTINVPTSRNMDVQSSNAPSSSIVNQQQHCVSTRSKYATKAAGVVEISDSVFRNPISNDSNGAQLTKLACRISKMEVKLQENNKLLKELVKSNAKILNVLMVNGGMIGGTIGETNAGTIGGVIGGTICGAIGGTISSGRIISSNNPEPLVSTDNQEERNVAAFQPINTIAELEEFEEKLKLPQFKKKTFDKLLYHCNFSDKLTELDVFYIFVDAVFTREFFLLVSWAGGTKGTTTKTAFKRFMRTIEFFLSLIRTCHANFSLISCVTFFKNKSIANATSRARAPPQRASRTKSRAKTRSILDEDEFTKDETGDKNQRDTENGDDNQKAIENRDDGHNRTDIYDEIQNGNELGGKKHSILNASRSRKRNEMSTTPKSQRKRMRIQKMGFPEIDHRLLIDENDSSVDDCDFFNTDTTNNVNMKNVWVEEDRMATDMEPEIDKIEI